MVSWLHVKIYTEYLELFTARFLSGEISEGEYESWKQRVLDQMTLFEYFLYTLFICRRRDMFRYLRSIYFIINVVILCVLGGVATRGDLYTIVGIALMGVQFFRLLIDILYVQCGETLFGGMTILVSRKAKKVRERVLSGSKNKRR